MDKEHKRIAARVLLAMLLLLCAVFGTACGKKEGGDAADGKKIEGDLQDIMAKIYEGVEMDAETKAVMQGYVSDTLNDDNEAAILGSADVPYIEGIYSVPMMSSVAYQCVLIRVAPEDVETVKTTLKENADVNKWVCVSAETVLVENAGDLVLFIMSDKDAAYAVSASFQALAK